MTNKEAVMILRVSKQMAEYSGPNTVSDAFTAGADAIELLDWLFRLDGNGHMRAPGLLDRWNGEVDFEKFAKEEMRRGLHAL